VSREHSRSGNVEDPFGKDCLWRVAISSYVDNYGQSKPVVSDQVMLEMMVYDLLSKYMN
jgi:hypothetical protein